MKTLMPAALAALSVAAIPALSHAQVSPEYYGSVGYGSTRADGADVGALQGRLGAKLTPHFGVEGEVGVGVTDDKTYVAGAPVNVELKHQAAAYAVGYLPVTPQIDLLARAGYGTSKFKSSLAGVSSSESQDSWNYGVGAQYKLDDKNGLRADWTKSEFTNSKADADTLAVSYVRKF